MDFKTKPGTWMRAIPLDIVLIGGLAFMVFGSPPAMFVNVIIFALWALTLLRLFAAGVMTIATAVFDDDEEKMKEIWTDKNVESIAYGQGFLYYHVITDIAVVLLLAATGRFWLASIMLITLILSCMMIGQARKLKIERSPAHASL